MKIISATPARRSHRMKPHWTAKFFAHFDIYQDAYVFWGIVTITAITLTTIYLIGEL